MQGATTLRSATTDSNGNYVISFYNGGGVYNIRATKTGFTQVDLTNVTIYGDVRIDINPPVSADVTPPAGSVTINSGSTSTNDNTVLLSLLATDAESGMGTGARMKFSNDDISWSENQAYGTSKIWSLSEGDGSKTVYVKFCDAAGNWTASQTANIIFDTITPAGSVSINGGALTVSGTNITLNLSCSDAGSGMGAGAGMLFSNDGYNWTSKESYAATRSWSLPAGNGSKRVYLKVNDAAGNVLTLSAAVVLNTGATDNIPPSGSVIINSGDSYTKTTTVTLALSAADASGVAQMQFSNDNAAWSTPESYAVSKIWTMTSGDGLRTVYVKFKDNSAGGNWSSNAESDTINLDTTAPVAGTIALTARYTTTTAVTVLLQSSDTGSGVASMRFANNGGAWSTPETYATSKSWNLGGAPDGTKTVTVGISDAVGNWCANLTKTITYDTTPPVNCAFTINGGAASTYSNQVTIRPSPAIADPTSGLTTMQYSTDGASYTSTTYASIYTPWISGTGLKTIYMKFTDKAGNVSVPVTQDITINGDTTPPTGTFQINDGAAYTTAQLVTISNNYVDTESGISTTGFGAGIQIKNEADSWYSWLSYNPVINWNLSTGEGVKTVTMMVADSNYNWTSPASVTIVYDITAPTGTITINAGNLTTNNQNVMLKLFSSDANISKMNLSNDGSAWNGWEDYTADKNWALLPGDGAKTVHVQYRDLGQNVSPVYTANITLNTSGGDTEPPVGTISINGNTASTNSLTVTLSLTAIDQSGLSEMRFSNDGTSYSAAEAFAGVKVWSLSAGGGVKTVYARYKDAAGNWNTGNSIFASILLDFDGPTGTITCKTYVNSYSVQLTVSASDTSSVSKMCVSNDGVNWSTPEAYAVNKFWQVENSEGLKTIYAKFQDGLDNWSGAVTTATTLDYSLPQGTLTINGGAAATKTRTITLTMTASDTVPVATMSFDPGNGWTTAEAFSTGPKVISLSGGSDGVRYVYARYNDTAGNSSSSSPYISSSIIYDVTGPSGYIIANNGALYTNTGTVTLSLPAVDLSGLSKMQFSDNGSTYTTLEPYSGTKVRALTAGDGAKTIYVKYSDILGNLSGAYSTGITLSTVLPAGTLSINGGAPSTASTLVTLTLSASDGTGLTGMQFSNDGSTWTGEETYAALKIWSLTSGDAVKTVFVKFKNGAGTWSTAVTSGITLNTSGGDTTAPTGTISINTGAATTGTPLVTIALSAADASGISQMQFSADGISWSTPESYAASKNWYFSGEDGSRIVYVKYKDNSVSGNWSISYPDGIILDIEPPEGTFAINGGAVTTSSVTVTVSSSFADTGSSMASMRFSNDGTGWSAAESYNASKTWVLDAVEGVKTVYAKYSDATGNWSSPETVNINLDLPPVASILINYGVSYTQNYFASITADVTETGSSLVSTATSNDGTNWTYQNYYNPYSFQMTRTDGAKTVYAKFRDYNGNWSNTCTDDITLDSTLPAGSILINSGALTTFSTNVTLALSGIDTGSGVVSMMFSNTGSGFTTAEAYNTSKVWTLLSGDGEKTVYVRFIDAAGNYSVPYSSDITLNSLGVPVPAVSSVNPASILNTEARTVTITGTGYYGGGASANVSLVVLNTSPTATTVTGWTCVSDSSIASAVVPAGVKGGTYDVLVTTSGGTNATSAVKLTVTATAPAVTNLTPTGCNYGDTCTLSLTGSGFFGGTASNDVTAVKLYSSPSSNIVGYTVVNNTTITGVVIPGSVKSGTYALKVTTNGGGEGTGSNFGIVSPTPAVTVVTPSNGFRHVLNTVALTGSGYFGGQGVNSVTAVSLAGATSTVNITTYTVASDNSITGMVIPSGITAETYDIRITANGRTNLTSAAKYEAKINGTTPKISSASGNASELNIIYDSDMDLSTVTNKANYTVASPVGSIIADKTAWILTYSARALKISGIALTSSFAVTVSGSVLNDALNPILTNGVDNTATGAIDAVSPTGTIIINSGAVYTTTAAITLTITSSEGGAGAKMQFSKDGSVWDAIEDFASTKSYSFNPGDGIKTIYMKLRDPSGNWSGNITDTIILDTTLPAGTISINSGDTITGSTSVVLTLSAVDTNGVTEMQFSDDNLAWTGIEPYNSLKNYTLNSTDGTKTVYLRLKDAAGNWTTANITDTIILDTAGPSGTISINGGSGYTNSTTVTLALSAADTGIGMGAGSQMKFSDDNSTWTAPENYAAGKVYTLPAGEGLKTVYVKYSDALGNWCTCTISDVIALDTTLPAGTISINAGAVYAASVTVTLALTSSDSNGVLQMQFSNDGSTWSSPEANGAAKTWTLIAGDGNKTVYVKYKDAAGNWSGALSDAIILDATAPNGSINANSGATYTSNLTLGLTLLASDTWSTVVSMRFSNDGSAWSTPDVYATSKSWIVAAGDGLKTVYVQYRDGAGNWSGSITDTITLDTSAPTGSININSGAVSTNNTTVTLSLSATDTGSGVVSMQLSNNGSSWLPYAYTASKVFSISAAEGTKTVYVKYTDALGNTSGNITDTISLCLVQYLKVEATPDKIISGDQVTIKVTACLTGGTMSTNYYNSVVYNNSDINGISLGMYTFSGTGTRNVTNNNVFKTIGRQTISVVDSVLPAVSGSVTVKVYDAKLISAATGGIFTSIDGTSMYIPAGALASDMYLGFSVTDNPVDCSSDFKLKQTVNPVCRDYGELSITPWELRDVTFNKPVTVTIPYSSADITGLNEQALRIFYYDNAKGRYEIVPGVQTAGGGKVTASVTKFTTYRIMGTFISSNLDNVTGYPNPFNPETAYEKKFKVMNLPRDCTMTIYNIAGEKVRELSEANQTVSNAGWIEWDGKNETGETVAMGVYVYVIKTADGQKKIGKIGLIK